MTPRNRAQCQKAQSERDFSVMRQLSKSEAKTEVIALHVFSVLHLLSKSEAQLRQHRENALIAGLL